jgi:rhodanese-related sulfurtransferase
LHPVFRSLRLIQKADDVIIWWYTHPEPQPASPVHLSGVAFGGSINMLKADLGAGPSVSLQLFASAVVFLGLASLPFAAAAQTVQIVDGLTDVQVMIDSKAVTIRRNQDETATIVGDFAKTSRACPPFCIQPTLAATGVSTVAELEVIGFLQDRVGAGAGILLDARLPEWFAKGSIPGAVNVPFATLSPNNPYRNDILLALGATPLGGDQFDFTDAPDLLVFCNGAWSDQSVRALKSLRAAGYPAEKLMYYRGGMQDWQILGLTVMQADNVTVAGAKP